jgi:hypothetical protein
MRTAPPYTSSTSTVPARWWWDVVWGVIFIVLLLVILIPIMHLYWQRVQHSIDELGEELLAQTGIPGPTGATGVDGAGGIPIFTFNSNTYENKTCTTC